MIDSIVAGLNTGSRISHFTILQKLGEGGMGVVYQARDLRLDRLVALKVLSDHTASDPDRQARLVQEAKSASSLNHPHIVTVHEIDTVDGLTFIAMEFIGGRTLDEVIPSRGLRYPDVLKYAVQIADGLAAAHAIGIIHRDVKPANVMVSGGGVVKILDFGLAKLVKQPAPSRTGETVTMALGSPLTGDGAVVGTVAYMSPEQAEGKPLDVRSDIFSFGIVLYEMLTGHRPFVGDTPASTMAALISKEPKPVRQIVEGLPAEVDRLVSRCLRKDPARRIQTMADLAVALRDLKDDSDSGTLTAAVAAKPRRKVGWLVAAGAGLLAAAGLWMATQRMTEPVQTVSTVTNYAGSELQPAFSPDGKQVAFSWDGEKGGNFDIYVKLVGEAEVLRLTNDAATDSFPTWSLDGKRIIFRRVGPLGGVYSVSALGGGEQKVASVPGNGPVSWSRDGKWLAFSTDKGSSDRTGVVILPVESADAGRISDAASKINVSRPVFSHSGLEVAYSSCHALYSCDMYIQELNPDATLRGEARRLTQQNLGVYDLAWSLDGSWLAYNARRSPSDGHLWLVASSGNPLPRRLDIAGARVSSPAFDHSGRRLLYSSTLDDMDLWSFREGFRAEAIAVSTSAETRPQFSPDGKRIAFQSGRTGSPEIWVANADGSQPVQLTNRVGRFQGTPRWSPDGLHIAFDVQGQEGGWDIFVIESGGGRSRRLTHEPSEEYIPSWSRDGKWIYFGSTRTGRLEIWRMPSAGGRQERTSIGGGHSAFVSVDGKALFYLSSARSDAALMVRPVSGGPETELIPFATRAFQPTAQGIYFVGRSAESAQLALRFYDFATRKTRVIETILQPTVAGLTVAPDGKTIVFAASQKTGADLMMIENFR